MLRGKIEGLQWDGRKEESRKERERKGERFRERDSTFSLNFPDDRIGGFRWSKRKISTSWQGLRIETGVGEFWRKLQEVGVFSYLVESLFKGHSNGMGCVRP